MIDLNYLQANLPTTEQQLDFLLSCLNNRADNFNFNLVSEVDRSEKLIYKIGGETKLNTEKYLEDKKEYITFKIKSILRQLIIGIVTYSKERQYQTLYILKPEALLEKTYISLVKQNEDLYLVGIIGIYFE